MSDLVISLIIAVSSFAWVYNKFTGRTGGDTQRAIIVAGVAAAAVFIVFMTLLAVFL